MNVCEGNGRGGLAGTHLKVALSSLSEELQGRLRGQLVPAEELPPIMLAETALRMPAVRPSESDTLEFRLQAISDAIEHPKWSTARGQAVKAASRQYGKPERTLLRWIAAYESIRRRITSERRSGSGFAMLPTSAAMTRQTGIPCRTPKGRAMRRAFEGR